MNARLLMSHLAVAALVFGLGYAVFSSGARVPKRPEDPVAALIDATRIQDVHARTQAVLDFFATADPTWAKPLLDEVSRPGSDLVLDESGEALFAAWWAKSDPYSAFINRVEPVWTNRHPWIREVMLAWVAKDPARAAEAADTLPKSADRGNVEATRVLVDHWWDNKTAADPAPLLGLIQKLEVRPRAGAIEKLIQSSIEHRGIDATEQFVESIPEQESFARDMRQEMLARFGQALLDHDVERAKQWGAKYAQTRDGGGILRHLAFSWGLKDGATAMNWAIHLSPETPSRPEIILRVWLSYRHAHPDEAADWLLAQEPTEVLGHIFGRYLTGTTGADPDKALAVANRAKDPALREQLLTAVGMGWMKTDPEAATRWLDTVELAPELEERVRSVTSVGPADNTLRATPTS